MRPQYFSNGNIMEIKKNKKKKPQKKQWRIFRNNRKSTQGTSLYCSSLPSFNYTHTFSRINSFRVTQHYWKKNLRINTDRCAIISKLSLNFRMLKFQNSFCLGSYFLNTFLKHWTLPSFLQISIHPYSILTIRK